ncbi:unnamed protein product [Peniophora sp. CBMAI 1063]|nr:unnamed protein product [Peniophora sp. CBMAI 1063]
MLAHGARAFRTNSRFFLPFTLFSSSANAQSSNPSARQLREMSVKNRVESTISENKVVVFSKSYCPYCRRAKSLFATEFPETEVTVVELDEDSEGSDIQAYLAQKTGQSTVPNIFINQKHIGGSDDLAGLNRVGGVKKLLL